MTSEFSSISHLTWTRQGSDDFSRYSDPRYVGNTTDKLTTDELTTYAPAMWEIPEFSGLRPHVLRFTSVSFGYFKSWKDLTRYKHFFKGRGKPGACPTKIITYLKLITTEEKVPN